MKIKAKRPVQLNGHICSPGEVVEYEGPVTDRIRFCFETEDGKPIGDLPKDGVMQGTPHAPPPKKSSEDRIDMCVRRLGVDGIRRKLDEMNITYHPSSNGKRLAKLLLENLGEINME